ncbi:MAG: LEA type 2 family protein [Methanolinea sp.]|jgi:LEA14-like dessication related protein|nr:LEA type 2 family protein [Methanolinea sp.]
MAGIGTPKIEIENISVTNVSLSEIGLLVSVTLENGNPVAIPVEQIDFDIIGIVGGKARTVARGQHGGHSIPPGHSTLDIPVVIQNSETIGALSEFVLERSIDLRVSGYARVGIAIMSCDIPFSEERKIHF